MQWPGWGGAPDLEVAGQGSGKERRRLGGVVKTVEGGSGAEGRKKGGADRIWREAVEAKAAGAEGDGEMAGAGLGKEREEVWPDLGPGGGGQLGGGSHGGAAARARAGRRREGGGSRLRAMEEAGPGEGGGSHDYGHGGRWPAKERQPGARENKTVQ